MLVWVGQLRSVVETDFPHVGNTSGVAQLWESRTLVQYGELTPPRQRGAGGSPTPLPTAKPKSKSKAGCQMSRKMEELAAYFYQHAFLAYHRYRQVKNDHVMGDNKDRRKAIDAAVALYHLREHIPQPFRKSRAQLAALCPDYDLLGDIVNAAKHNVLTRGAPQVTGSDSISENLVCTRFSDQDGEYNHQEKIVEVELVDGSRRDIYEILTNVVNMWFDELHRIGAIDWRQPIQLNRQDLVSREDASSVALQMTQGIQWKQRFRFQQYNYESNEIEPVDLSGAKDIIFTVHKPQTFEVEMRDTSGMKFAREIELTPEQAGELKQIDDPSQRDQYLWEIAANRGVVEQMIVEYQNAKNKER